MNPKHISFLKISYIGIGGILNLIAPTGSEIKIADIRIFILPVLTILILLPFSAEFLNGRGHNFRKPDWHDSPFNLYYPLSAFHFYGWFFLVYGIGMVAGTYYKFNQLNHPGVLSVLFGIGIFSAIKFVIEFAEKSEKREK